MSSVEDDKISLQDLPIRREQYYRSIFDVADLDANGFITSNELNEMIRTNSHTDEPVPKSEIIKIHQMADTNYDGQLDYNEFVKMIKNRKLKHVFGRYVTTYVNFVVPGRQLLYDDEYTCCPPRLGVIIIAIIELICFMTDEFMVENSASGPIAKIFIYDPSKKREIWRFFTYMFVHDGVAHFTFNLAFQIIIAIPLEMVHGSRRVLLICFAGVVAGSLSTSITDPTAKLAGASGGVYSLLTAHIATIILNWRKISFPEVKLFIFALFTIFGVGSAIYDRYYTNMDESIGYIAHVFGAVAGLLVGISVLRNFEVTWIEKKMRWISGILYLVLLTIGICWNIFYR